MGILLAYDVGSGEEGHEGLPDRVGTVFQQDVTRVAIVKWLNPGGRPHPP